MFNHIINNILYKIVLQNNYDVDLYAFHRSFGGIFNVGSFIYTRKCTSTNDNVLQHLFLSVNSNWSSIL